MKILNQNKLKTVLFIIEFVETYLIDVEKNI